MAKTAYRTKYSTTTSRQQSRANAPMFRITANSQKERTIARANRLIDAYRAAGFATFVATELRIITHGMTHAEREVAYNSGVIYYRLTPIYYAYLAHCFANAGAALTSGKLSESDYRNMLDRMSQIHTLAVATWGTDILAHVKQSFAPLKWHRHVDVIRQAEREGHLTDFPYDECGEDANGSKRPAVHDSHTAAHNLKASAETAPSIMPDNWSPLAPAAPAIPAGAFLFPAGATTGAYCHVTHYALDQVDAIKDRALAAGWEMDQLYRNIGIAPGDWGLVCFIGMYDRIGAVTPQSIEVITRINTANPRHLHFYNMRVPQPWFLNTIPEVCR